MRNQTQNPNSSENVVALTKGSQIKSDEYQNQQPS